MTVKRRKYYINKLLHGNILNQVLYIWYYIRHMSQDY